MNTCLIPRAPNSILFLEQITDYLNFRNDVPTIVLTGYCLSIPTQFVLLTVAPLKHRVLLGNMVRVLWTCYLTHASNTGTQSGLIPEEAE